MKTLVLLLALVPALARSQDAAPAEEVRYHALIAELRCLVCQNQSIAESNAPLAQDLREQVRAQIAAGRSDAEIMQFLTDRYGDFVLYRPPLKARTWLLWLGPFGVLVLAGVWALRRTRHRAAEARRADPEALARLLREDDGSR